MKMRELWRRPCCDALAGNAMPVPRGIQRRLPFLRSLQTTKKWQEHVILGVCVAAALPTCLAIGRLDYGGSHAGTKPVSHGGSQALSDRQGWKTGGEICVSLPIKTTLRDKSLIFYLALEPASNMEPPCWPALTGGTGEAVAVAAGAGGDRGWRGRGQRGWVRRGWGRSRPCVGEKGARRPVGRETEIFCER
jgi:hypothetical protein